MSLFSWLKPQPKLKSGCLVECVAWRDLKLAHEKLTANSDRWCKIVQFWYQRGNELKAHGVVAWQFGNKLLIYDPDMDGGKGGSRQVAEDPDEFSKPSAWEVVRFYTKLPVTKAEFFEEK